MLRLNEAAMHFPEETESGKYGQLDDHFPRPTGVFFPVSMIILGSVDMH